MEGAVMILDYEKAKRIHELFNELHALLREQKENNWCNGINAATQEISNHDGMIDIAGFENARSIYKTMMSGGRGFAQYFVWKEDQEERIKANEKLDALRLEIWRLFES